MDSLQEAVSPLPPFLQLLLLSGGSSVWGGDWESWKCCAPPTRSQIPLWRGGLAWVWHLRQKIRLLPWALLSRCLPTDLRLALKPLSVCLVLSLAEAWGTHLPPSKTSALGSHPYRLLACLFCKLPPNICLCPTRGYGSSSGNICWVVIQTEYSWQMLCDSPAGSWSGRIPFLSPFCVCVFSALTVFMVHLLSRLLLGLSVSGA